LEFFRPFLEVLNDLVTQPGVLDEFFVNQVVWIVGGEGELELAVQTLLHLFDTVLQVLEFIFFEALFVHAHVSKSERRGYFVHQL